MNNMPRITEFDGLRGLLAWWVVAYHIMCNCGFSNSNFRLIKILQTGRYPVDVFIIISGFVIFFLLEHRNEKYSTFIVRRFFRLYPVYIFCFFVAVITAKMPLENMHIIPWSSAKYIARIEQEHHQIWQHITSHIVMLHGILPNEILPNSTNAFLSPAWSISLEWQFYLVAPLVFTFIKRSPSSFLTISGLVILLDKFSHIWGHYPNPGFLPLEIKHFWLGGFSFYILKFLLEHKNLLYSTRNYLLISIATLVIVFIKSVPIFIWSIVFSVILIKYNCTDTNKITSIIAKILNYKYLQKLGEVSYSTYLSHVPILYICQWYILKIFPVVSKKEMLVMLTVSVVPIDIFVSILLFKIIEKPFISLGTKLVKKL